MAPRRRRAIDGAGTYLFPQRKAKLMLQLRYWTADRLFAAAERVEQAIFESRIKPALGGCLVVEGALQSSPRRSGAKAVASEAARW